MPTSQDDHLQSISVVINSIRVNPELLALRSWLPILHVI